MKFFIRIIKKKYFYPGFYIKMPVFWKLILKMAVILNDL
jgi:hypothetical protein